MIAPITETGTDKSVSSSKRTYTKRQVNTERKSAGS